MLKIDFNNRYPEIENIIWSFQSRIAQPGLTTIYPLNKIPSALPCMTHFVADSITGWRV